MFFNLRFLFLHKVE